MYSNVELIFCVVRNSEERVLGSMRTSPAALARYRQRGNCVLAFSACRGCCCLPDPALCQAETCRSSSQAHNPWIIWPVKLWCNLKPGESESYHWRLFPLCKVQTRVVMPNCTNCVEIESKAAVLSALNNQRCSLQLPSKCWVESTKSCSSWCVSFAECAFNFCKKVSRRHSPFAAVFLSIVATHYDTFVCSSYSCYIVELWKFKLACQFLQSVHSFFVKLKTLHSPVALRNLEHCHILTNMKLWLCSHRGPASYYTSALI